MPLASARQHPENQKENQAGHSPERTVEGQGGKEGRPALDSQDPQPEGQGMNEIGRESARTMANLASARQHVRKARPAIMERAVEGKPEGRGARAG